MKTFLQFKNTICFLLLSGAFLFSGCSSSPSPNQAEQQLSQIITSKSKGQIKLIGFQKTNGQKVDNDSYEMTYQAEIEFEADSDWTGEGNGLGIGGDYFNFTATKDLSQGVFGMTMTFHVGHSVQKGDHATVAGALLCSKWESGWKFEGEGGAPIVISIMVSEENKRREEEKKRLAEKIAQEAADCTTETKTIASFSLFLEPQSLPKNFLGKSLTIRGTMVITDVSVKLHLLHCIHGQLYFQGPLESTNISDAVVYFGAISKMGAVGVGTSANAFILDYG